MKSNYLLEIFIPIILISLLVLLFDPFMVLMPSSVQMLILVLVLIVFTFFSLFIWKEKSTDEREIMHRNIASRFAYLASATVLTIGVLIQSLNHTLDPWLLFALIIMILAKIIGLIYSQKKY